MWGSSRLVKHQTFALQHTHRVEEIIRFIQNGHIKKNNFSQFVPNYRWPTRSARTPTPSGNPRREYSHWYIWSAAAHADLDLQTAASLRAR